MFKRNNFYEQPASLRSKFKKINIITSYSTYENEFYVNKKYAFLRKALLHNINNGNKTELAVLDSRLCKVTNYYKLNLYFLRNPN